MYADTDFWVALLKDDDWLAERATSLLEEHRGNLEVSVATFIELFLIEERYDFDREQATLAIFELADSSVETEVVFQASAYIEDGLNTFDAFHAALAGDAILSSDQAFETISIDRVPLEPAEE
ncbi:type II toxin-antitoxin system VapC family toxin [Natronobiforma cellulositropha]|uniref:type II toxin-antitoxin system VapC family toxin n=1 Tax=Natronobiforma cellulositropha TaxID=1679076 RepID=UPI0021D5B0DA|nr:PIN domain-containing protein [Natronobiforma cellulositropha]